MRVESAGWLLLLQAEPQMDTDGHGWTQMASPTDAICVHLWFRLDDLPERSSRPAHESPTPEEGTMSVRLDRNLAFLLLGIWLIIWGLIQFIPAGIPGILYVLAIIAIIAGVLFIIRR
jgi:hypothetical protein